MKNYWCCDFVRESYCDVEIHDKWRNIYCIWSAIFLLNIFSLSYETIMKNHNIFFFHCSIILLSDSSTTPKILSFWSNQLITLKKQSCFCPSFRTFWSSCWIRKELYLYYLIQLPYITVVFPFYSYNSIHIYNLQVK